MSFFRVPLELSLGLASLMLACSSVSDPCAGALVILAFCYFFVKLSDYSAVRKNLLRLFLLFVAWRISWDYLGVATRLFLIFSLLAIVTEEVRARLSHPDDDRNRDHDNKIEYRGLHRYQGDHLVSTPHQFTTRVVLPISPPSLPPPIPKSDRPPQLQVLQEEEPPSPESTPPSSPYIHPPGTTSISLYLAAYGEPEKTVDPLMKELHELERRYLEEREQRERAGLECSEGGAWYKQWWHENYWGNEDWHPKSEGWYWIRKSDRWFPMTEEEKKAAIIAELDPLEDYRSPTPTPPPTPRPATPQPDPAPMVAGATPNDTHAPPTSPALPDTSMVSADPSPMPAAPSPKDTGAQIPVPDVSEEDRRFNVVCQQMAEASMDLHADIQEFKQNFPSADQPYRLVMCRIASKLFPAAVELQSCRPTGLTVQEGLLTLWPGPLTELWGYVVPHGDLILRSGDEDLEGFLIAVRDFCLFLRSDVPQLDMTPQRYWFDPEPEAPPAPEYPPPPPSTPSPPPSPPPVHQEVAASDYPPPPPSTPSPPPVHQEFAAQSSYTPRSPPPAASAPAPVVNETPAPPPAFLAPPPSQFTFGAPGALGNVSFAPPPAVPSGDLSLGRTKLMANSRPVVHRDKSAVAARKFLEQKWDLDEWGLLGLHLGKWGLSEEQLFALSCASELKLEEADKKWDEDLARKQAPVVFRRLGKACVAFGKATVLLRMQLGRGPKEKCPLFYEVLAFLKSVLKLVEGFSGPEGPKSMKWQALDERDFGRVFRMFYDNLWEEHRGKIQLIYNVDKRKEMGEVVVKLRDYFPNPCVPGS